MNTEADIRAVCHEFTDALAEVLAENAIGLARRGRVARAHAAIKNHPKYNEHAFCVAVETAFTQWEALQNEKLRTRRYDDQSRYGPVGTLSSSA
jgi:hypothetical protein